MSERSGSHQDSPQPSPPRPSSSTPATPRLKSPVFGLVLWGLAPLIILLTVQLSGVMDRFDGWLSGRVAKTAPVHPVRLSSAAAPRSAPPIRSAAAPPVSHAEPPGLTPKPPRTDAARTP